MTVAAVVLSPEPAAALSSVAGEPALRRVVQAAWSGGAIPIVVVTPSGSLAEGLRAATADVDVAFVDPGADSPGIAWFAQGLRSAVDAVAETSAALLWPVPHAWVDPETVTSLVEAHGLTPEAILRPAYGGRPGFPILVPASLLHRLTAGPGMRADEAVATLAAEGVPLRLIELGDPGIVHDMATPQADLPAYQGPPEPAGPPPEWNQALAEAAEP